MDDLAELDLDIPELSLNAIRTMFEARLSRCGLDHELRWRVP